MTSEGISTGKTEHPKYIYEHRDAPPRK